jgi:aryl-alcohol dehydrogenase-like predicted oxidoreductase
MNTFSVVSSSNISHMEQNLAAAGIHLTEPERRWLNLESDRVF